MTLPRIVDEYIKLLERQGLGKQANEIVAKHKYKPSFNMVEDLCNALDNHWNKMPDVFEVKMQNTYGYPPGYWDREVEEIEIAE